MAGTRRPRSVLRPGQRLCPPRHLPVCGPRTDLARAASMAGRYWCRWPATEIVIFATYPGPGPAAASARPRLANACRARRPGPFSFLAGAVPAHLADFLVDGPAPSWLVRVGTCLALHLPAGSHRLCLDRPGLLLHELGRRLFAILSGPGAKEAHSAAKKAHSGIIGRRLADFSHPEGQISRHVQVLRACQRRSDEWPGCEYRDDRQANRRCYRRVVAQCHAESDQRSGRRRLRSSGLGRPRLAARLAPRQPADHAL
jgi:hypothetical protein